MEAWRSERRAERSYGALVEGLRDHALPLVKRREHLCGAARVRERIAHVLELRLGLGEA